MNGYLECSHHHFRPFVDRSDHVRTYLTVMCGELRAQLYPIQRLPFEMTGSLDANYLITAAQRWRTRNELQKEDGQCACYSPSPASCFLCSLRHKQLSPPYKKPASLYIQWNVATCPFVLWRKDQYTRQTRPGRRFPGNQRVQMP